MTPDGIDDPISAWVTVLILLYCFLTGLELDPFLQLWVICCWVCLIPRQPSAIIVCALNEYACTLSAQRKIFFLLQHRKLEVSRFVEHLFIICQLSLGTSHLLSLWILLIIQLGRLRKLRFRDRLVNILSPLTGLGSSALCSNDNSLGQHQISLWWIVCNILFLFDTG